MLFTGSSQMIYLALYEQEEKTLGRSFKQATLDVKYESKTIEVEQRLINCQENNAFSYTVRLRKLVRTTSARTHSKMLLIGL